MSDAYCNVLSGKLFELSPGEAFRGCCDLGFKVLLRLVWIEADCRNYLTCGDFFGVTFVSMFITFKCLSLI